MDAHVTARPVRGFDGMTMDDGVTDAALVRRVLEGDAASFARLVDRHSAACLRYATRLLGERADAEEADVRA